MVNHLWRDKVSLGFLRKKKKISRPLEHIRKRSSGVARKIRVLRWILVYMLY